MTCRTLPSIIKVRRAKGHGLLLPKQKQRENTRTQGAFYHLNTPAVLRALTDPGSLCFSPSKNNKAPKKITRVGNFILSKQEKEKVCKGFACRHNNIRAENLNTLGKLNLSIETRKLLELSKKERHSESKGSFHQAGKSSTSNYSCVPGNCQKPQVKSCTLPDMNNNHDHISTPSALPVFEATDLSVYITPKSNVVATVGNGTTAVVQSRRKQIKAERPLFATPIVEQDIASKDLHSLVEMLDQVSISSSNIPTESELESELESVQTTAGIDSYVLSSSLQTDRSLCHLSGRSMLTWKYRDPLNQNIRNPDPPSIEKTLQTLSLLPKKNHLEKISHNSDDYNIEGSKRVIKSINIMPIYETSKTMHSRRQLFSPDPHQNFVHGNSNKTLYSNNISDVSNNLLMTKSMPEVDNLSKHLTNQSKDAKRNQSLAVVGNKTGLPNLRHNKNLIEEDSDYIYTTNHHSLGIIATFPDVFSVEQYEIPNAEDCKLPILGQKIFSSHNL